MTITLDLTQELHAELAGRATAQESTPEAYAVGLLEEALDIAPRAERRPDSIPDDFGGAPRERQSRIASLLGAPCD